jgi:hypothetical protein
VFVRVTVRNNKNGPPARYLQVVHNYRPPGGGASRSKVLLNLGRVEDVDGGDLARLAKSILKHVGPEDLARADLGELLSDDEDDEHGVDIPTNGEESVRIGVASSRQIGVQLLLWTLWVSCGLDTLFRRIAAETKMKKNLSKLVFLIVLNRTLAYVRVTSSQRHSMSMNERREFQPPAAYRPGIHSARSCPYGTPAQSTRGRSACPTTCRPASGCTRSSRLGDGGTAAPTSTAAPASPTAHRRAA